MVQLQARIRGGDAVIKRLNSRGKKIRESSKQEILALGKYIETVAKNLAPSATGALKRSITLDTSNLDDGYVRVHTDGIPYAKYQETGFRGHYIHRSAYHHQGGVGFEGGANWFFVQNNTPFFAPAVEQAKGIIGDSLKRIVKYSRVG